MTVRIIQNLFKVPTGRENQLSIPIHTLDTIVKGKKFVLDYKQNPTCIIVIIGSETIINVQDKTDDMLLLLISLLC